MEFDSLAFSAARSAPAQEDRVYCPACLEVCLPETGSEGGGANAEPTCPTCGEVTVARPPLDQREACTAATTAAAAAAAGRAATGSPGEDSTAPTPSTTAVAVDPTVPPTDGASPPPPAAPTALPPPPAAAATNDAPRDAAQGGGGRAAATERVAREVLVWMAALERGDLPTAVELPAPPGAAIFEELPGLGGAGGGGGGGAGSRSAPALEQVVKDLPRIQVEENSWVLHQTVLRLTGPSELCVDAVFAPFSPPPSESVLGPVVLAVPPTADAGFENEAEVKGSVLVIDRGVCTFAAKALRANAAGAAAAVIVQTSDVWPYVMEDSTGEVEAGGGIDIPVCMVSKSKGEEIKKAVQAVGEGEVVGANLSVSSSEKDCIVCQDLFAVGATLVRLPCGHLYHEHCVLKWLKLSNTCPYCRSELPSSNKDVERARRRSREAATGGEAWRVLFD